MICLGFTIIKCFNNQKSTDSNCISSDIFIFLTKFDREGYTNVGRQISMFPHILPFSEIIFSRILVK